MSDNPIEIAERNVLGGIMVSCEAIPPGLEMLTPDDFSDRRHAAIFSAMLALHERKEPVDLVTVNHELESHGVGPKGSWFKLLSEITDESFTSANVAHYASLVRKDSRRRDCAHVMGSALQQAKNPGADGDEIIASVVTELGQLAESRALVRPALLKDLVRDEFKAIERRHASGEVVGIATGFEAIDRVLGGLQPGGLTVIAARPSMGKSALATGILANVVLRGGGSALMFSLEMTQQEQVQRLLASESRVDLNRIRTGQGIGESDWPKLAAAMGRLYSGEFAVVDKPALEVAELRSVARQYASRHKVGVIGVDYLQLMRGKGDTREQEVAAVSRGLKALAMELKIPVIALSQLNRSVESRTDKRPSLSDLRDSGSIEQDADQVLLIYRDDYYHPNTKDPGLAEIAVAKNRNGPTGMIKLRWAGKYTRFDSVDREGLAA